MQAALFHEPGAMRFETVPDPAPLPGDMVIRMTASAICGTDIRIWRGRKTRGVRRPSILGHEFAGEILDSGGQPGWRVGDRVALCPALSCGSCRECRAGAANICSHLTAFGYEVDGSFAELIRIPRAFVDAGHVFRVADGMPAGHAALAEPLACVINGQELAGVREGDKVAVLGAGPIGLLHVMLARHKGAGKIVAVQRSAHRRRAALDLGADMAVTAEEAEGFEADVTIVAVGAVDLANLALRMTRPRGRINLFAGFPVGEPAHFDLNTLHYAEHHVTGAFGLTRQQFAAALDLVASGKLPVGKLISHRLPLSQAMDAFAIAEQGNALKVVVTDG